LTFALRKYPDLNFIIPHLGGFADDWMTHMHLIDQLCRFPNVYADTSWVRYWDCLVQAVKRAGPHKIIFGSDGPLLHPGVELYKIKMLGLPWQQESLVTGGNIARLIGYAARDSNDHIPRTRGSLMELTHPV
jgi:uncharacterized protein